MKQFLITVAGVLVGGFLLLLLPLLFLMIVGSAISAFTSNSSKPEENTVLVYNLETIVTDYQATDPIGAFSAAFGGNKYDAITLSKLTATLQAAAADDNISCLMLRGTSSGASYSAMKEILPYYGITLEEVPRLSNANGNIISATRVRKAIKEKNLKDFLYV